MYPEWLYEILRCPETLELLACENNKCICPDGKEYPVLDGILSLVYPPDITGSDAKMNAFYNKIAPYYDFVERVLGKLLTGVDVVQGRKEIISLLGLKPGMRILEVSPGPGVFQPYLRKAVGDNGEIVSFDLSLPMLHVCRMKNESLNIYLIHGNAQYLPFADNSFDALFHFGGVNLFNDPRKAISEFVRVVKSYGIVSWGDEGFSKKYPDNFRKKILSKINPGYLKPKPPVPDSVYDVREYEVYAGLAYLVVCRKK